MKLIDAESLEYFAVGENGKYQLAVWKENIDKAPVINETKLFVYASANAMKEHRFTDDVAITYAKDIDEAVLKFSRLYDDIQIGEIDEVYFNDYGIAILTDY